MSVCRSVPLLLAMSAFASAGSLLDDVGYAGLVTQDLKEADNVEITMVGDAIPDWVDGTMYQQGPGRWEVGGMKMTHILDGFTRMNKWSFQGNKVTFSSKFPMTQSLNMSIHEDKITWGVLAQETEPPRVNPGLKGFINAPNDNMNVNNWMYGDTLYMLSDVATLVGVNKSSLAFESVISAQKMKNVSTPSINMDFGILGGGSAHPHCDESDGAYVSLRESDHPMMMGKGYMSVYKIHADKPDTVQDIVGFSVPRASYTHSFGLTKGMQGGDRAVVVAQPVYTNIMKLMESGTLKKGFDSPKDRDTTIHILPMDNSRGDKQITINHKAFYFGHFINTFSPGPGRIVFDLNVQSDIFFDRFSMDVQTDKLKRDTWAEKHGNAYSTPTRFEVDLESGTIVSEKKLFPDHSLCGSSKWCEMDLFDMHPDDFGRDYCGFWATHNFWNSSSFAATAIVRTDLCSPGGPKVAAHWYQRNVYPGEPRFVPKPGASDKTEGVLIFKVYEGETGLSKIVVADAKTLKTISTGVLPVHIPFTVHGQWYATSGHGSCQQRNLEKNTPSSVYV